MSYRVRVKCLKCGEEYTSRKMEEKKTPEKCKECSSIKIVENPNKKKVYFKV